MFRNLCCGAIGVAADFEQSLAYAQLGGYQGIDVPLGEIGPVVDVEGPEGIKARFAETGLQMGSIGFPASWQGREEEWATSLQNLPAYCKWAQLLGATRSATWVPSWSEERTWRENMKFHVHRFQPIAEIMGEYHLRLGLEFLGPQTLRRGKKFGFIHTLDAMLELADKIGTGNVGLLLDAWHWYTSGGEVCDLLNLTNADVVYVHINDAPVGVALEEQMDGVRMVSGESGVIDLAGFLGALKAIGYDGPVTPEPFSQKVREMPAEEAVSYTGRMLAEVWAKAGV